MKKNDRVCHMLEKIKFLDFIMGIILILIVYFRAKEYLLAVVLGCILAIINFHVNTYITTYALTKKSLNANMVIIFGYFLRIFIVGIIGTLIFIHNEINVIAYVIGYTTHLISIVLYGINLK
ncbi:ATP synthase subunit I [Clostridium aestuarii]|uniref:ATP synthase subunit I n=1 Tax=Clostridium aestuarii TaxID=338193 RepID=A0ABT4D312_9CLOT|nr:ATP synthase subunit I [Clostridium aestuarii]MCY6485621.1 ATP synthase subunit I [Clostridium aestuarii]